MEQLSKEPKGTQKNDQSTDDESKIQDLLEGMNDAFKSKNLDEIMKFYADDVIAYDMMPPLQYKGKENYRKAWEKGLSQMGEVENFEQRDLRIELSSDVAFAHYLCHMKGSMKDGKKMDTWTRYTGGFKKIEGEWLIIHEQFSVPLDMKGEKPLWDLTPGDGPIH